MYRRGKMLLAIRLVEQLRVDLLTIPPHAHTWEHVITTLPSFELQHLWYLSVGTVALQAVVSWWLLSTEFRKRLGGGSRTRGSAERGLKKAAPPPNG